MLSRPPAEDKGDNDNTNLTLLPPAIFVNSTSTLEANWTSTQRLLLEEQLIHQPLMRVWERSRQAIQEDGLWTVQGKNAVPPNDDVKRLITQQCHDTPTTGHPGRDRTIELLKRTYWWPDLRKWATAYVR